MPPRAGWPAIEEPELRRRLSLGSDDFLTAYCGFLREVGPRPFADADWRLALGYPWARPAGSFILDDGRHAPLEAPELDDATGRWPLLAIGSNGAPATLTRKLAHLPAGERRLAVEAGWIEGIDVAAAGFPTVYGAFAATLVPSPGTRLRASILWVTPAQLTALAWTETSYRLGRIAPVRFAPDVPRARRPEAVLAFVSRWGALTLDGAPCPLAALAAERRARAGWSQEALLDRAARLALGPAARGRDLVEAIFTDLVPTARAVRAALEPHAEPFGHAGWAPYPG